MATLEKIRNKSGLLIVVIGVALFAFIIGDFLKDALQALQGGNDIDGIYPVLFSYRE